MNMKAASRLLDRVAHDSVPDDVNLLPRIAARFEQGNKEKAAMQLRIRWITLVLLVVIGLLALSGVAYAVYHWMNDPGLRSVQDAGLVSTLAATGQPVAAPTLAPTPTMPPAALIGVEQTVEGVSVSLDWAHLGASRLALGFTVRSLPADLALDVPQVTFVGVIPMQPRGASFVLREQRSPQGGREARGELSAGYVSYQVVHTAGENVALEVSVPLVRRAGTRQTVVGVFHYKASDIPIIQGPDGGGNQTYEARYNGVELRLRSLNVAPGGSEAVLCAGDAVPANTWSAQGASLALGKSAPVPASYTIPLDIPAAGACLRIGFPTGSVDGTTDAELKMMNLVSVKGVKIDGTWQFNVSLPDGHAAPGQAAPTPVPDASASPWGTTTPALGEQSLQGVTVTLDWAFADARRVAVGYTVRGLPDTPDAIALNGRIVLKDANGNVQDAGGSSTIQRVAGQPGALTGAWSTLLRQPLTVKESSFSLEITLGGGSASDYNNQIAQFALSPDVTRVPREQRPALPAQEVGAFHFDFTVPVYPQQVLEPGLAVTANGIEMRLVRLELTPSYANATLCYRKPSMRDWTTGGLMDNPTLQFGDAQANLRTYSLIYDQDMGGYVGKAGARAVPIKDPAGRCVQIDFLLGNANRAGKLTLTVPMLEQSGPEVIPDSEIQAAQARLKAQGIEMSYKSFNSGRGGGSGPEFTKLPDGMTFLEAYRKFFEALGYAHPGPWVFEVEVGPSS